MKMGDRVRIKGGEYAGKTGTIVNTRGSHISNFVFVQLDRVVQGRLAAGLPHPALRVGISLRYIANHD